MNYSLQQRLDAFVSGECNPNAFVEELFVLCDTTPDSAWDALALIDQYYRRGNLSADLFRTLKYKIERHVLGVPELSTFRELPNGPTAAEALDSAAPGGAIAMVAAHEPTASPNEAASEVRALRIELTNARRSVHRFRKRLAIAADLGRRTRSALANTQHTLGVWRRQAGDYCERLRSIGWRRFVREHINGEFIGLSVAVVLLAAVLLGIEESGLPQDLPGLRDTDSPRLRNTANVVLPPAAAVVIPENSDPGQISLSADSYVVFPGQASAEIQIRRTGGVSGAVSFVWWTQGSGGTRPGRDYVSRTPTIAHLLDGEDTLHLSVSILPNPSRKHTELFYVVIGKPGDGAALGSVRRATVFIMRPDKFAEPTRTVARMRVVSAVEH
jgi:hypothetical protein